MLGEYEDMSYICDLLYHNPDTHFEYLKISLDKLFKYK